MTERKVGSQHREKVKRLGKTSQPTVEDLLPRLPDGRAAYIFDMEKWKKDAERYGYLSTEDLIRLTKWLQKYSGKIPESWGGPWYNLVQDLEDPEAKISDAQIFAAIEYPHWQVQQALGMNRSLTPVQLNALALMHYHSIFTFQEVLDKQLKLGASYQSVKAARFIFSAADDVMIAQAELGIPVP